MNNKIKSYDNPNNQSGLDLNVYQCGTQICPPRHGYGPAVRDHYLIHYISEGRGNFTIKGKTYKLKKGQGFLIPPNLATYYEADYNKPWTYMWVGFHGLKAELFLKKSNLTVEKPIFTDNKSKMKDILLEMINIDKTTHYSDLKLTGLLFLFIAELAKIQVGSFSKDYTTTEKYIQQAVKFIEQNYSRPIQINDIANHLSLNRSYFSNIFKNTLQVSPQQFLINYRMKRAADFLAHTQLPINIIAHSVGYSDPFNFSKMFKKTMNKSPSEYRTSHTKKEL